MIVSVKIRNPWSSEKYWNDCIELARSGESSWWHQVIEGDIKISISTKSFTDSHFPLFSFAHALSKFNTENEREFIFDPEDLDSEASGSDYTPTFIIRKSGTEFEFDGYIFNNLPIRVSGDELISFVQSLCNSVKSQWKAAKGDDLSKFF